MKRPSQDVAGRPRGRNVRPDVAGRSISSSQIELTSSYCRALYDPASAAVDDAALIEDFTEFIGGDEYFETGKLAAPDPVFQERLRRRLWRSYVVSYLRNAGKEIH